MLIWMYGDTLMDKFWNKEFREVWVCLSIAKLREKKVLVWTCEKKDCRRTPNDGGELRGEG